MFIRKLVKAGAASFTVALPKEWITGNSLEKGDVIYINRISNNELLISTELKTGSSKLREITLDIDNKQLDSLHRELTSAYINNYNTINITSKDLYKNIKNIRSMLSDFMGLEITEQTSTKIIAKDMLNLREVSIEKTIRRMDNIVRSVLKDSIASEEDMSESMEYRDSDIDRLYFLLFKIIKTSLREPETAKIVGITNYTEILSLWYLILNLEGIADNIKDIYSLALSLKKEPFYKEVTNLYKEIEKSYLDVMKSYYNKSKELADNVASTRKEIFDTISKISEKNKNLNVIKITENLKEIENSICNIARIVLDKE